MFKRAQIKINHLYSLVMFSNVLKTGDLSYIYKIETINKNVVLSSAMSAFVLNDKNIWIYVNYLLLSTKYLVFTKNYKYNI